MIKPLKPRAPANALSVFDIETGSNGELLDIGFCHEGDYLTFKTWLGFLRYCADNDQAQKISVLWAHNGGKFDTVALVCEMYRNDAIYKKIVKSYTAKLINGSILELDIVFLDDEHLLIRDSFRLFPMSLNKLLKSFGLEQKDEIPAGFISKMQEYKRLHDSAYYAYLKQDCIGLYKALKIFRETVNDISPVGDLPLSLGSLALKIYRTSFLKEEISTPNQKIQQFCEQAYSGGRTEYFGRGKKDKNNVYKKCNYYDYNSMYPAEMQTGYYPFGPAVNAKELMTLDNGELMPGAYGIDFKQTGGHIPLVRGLVDGKKTKEHVWQGSGIYTSDEVLYLQNIGAEIVIKKGYVFPQSKQIFKGFIDSIYNLRMESRAAKNAAMDLTCKLILNNLYGKFGQREEAEELQFLTYQEIVDYKERIDKGEDKETISIDFMTPEIDEPNEQGVYPCSVKKRCMVAHRHVLIAALITARCRIKITALAERYHKTAIYCDTDSFITQSKIDKKLICHNTLGMLKPEHENVDMEFFGRKQYRLIENDHDEIKQKGVKIVEKEKFVHDVRTAAGYKADYRAPASIKRAIKSGIENANKFDDYFRTIKADQSSEEKGLLK